MPEVFIKCPITGKTITTKNNLDANTLKGMKNTTLPNCPACGKTHIWDGKDAFFLDKGADPKNN